MEDKKIFVKGVEYRLDFQELEKYIFTKQENYKDKITEDSEIYEHGLDDELNGQQKLIQRQIKQTMGTDIGAIIQIKHDIIKTFFTFLMYHENATSENFGFTLIFNTLFEEGIIKRINQE